MAANENNDERSSAAVMEEYEDDEKPADVVGAKFFGGNAEKEDLYDPIAEAEADKVMQAKDEIQVYEKLQDPAAFPDDVARDFAIKLQNEIDDVLNNSGLASSSSMYSGSNIKWNSPLATDKCPNPIKMLQQALEFYNDLDVAILSSKSLSNSKDDIATMEVRWEICVIWPNAWESTASLSGTSQITYNTSLNQILSQKDSLDNGGKDGEDIVGALSSQLTPRFWDLYHIGMTPSAAATQRIPTSMGKSLLSQYDLFEIAPRLVLRPKLLDSGGRDMRTAQSLPNHSFTTAIKTMGPKKDKYVTTSPIEISIQKGEEKGTNCITWTVPLPPKVSKSSSLPLPVLEEDEVDYASCDYEYQPRRRVATLPFGGNPQDSEVSLVRKRLYESVMSDGLRPKMGIDGKPSFFFLQNDAKACFTEKGLGMAVYEWQPKFVKGNEIGIELEL